MTRGVRNTVADFWRHVDRTGGSASCWIWTLSVTTHGYGQYRLLGKVRRAHRIAYELLVGEIPTDLELDHLCRERRCCNPAHLEAVSHAENMRRMTEARRRERELRAA